jgi:putative heme-binding domain-containing protein
MLGLLFLCLAAPEPAPQDLAQAHWIWGSWAEEIDRPKGEIAAFRRTFDLPAAPAQGALAVATDNTGIAWLNGTRVGQLDDWQRAQRFDVTALLRPGRNELELVARNEDPGPAGLLAVLSVELAGGGSFALGTDGTWTSRRRREGGPEVGAWEPARVVRAFGDEPWGRIGIAEPGDSAWGGAEAPLAQRFEHPPGFAVAEAWAGVSSLIALALRADGALAAATEGGGVILLADGDGDGVFDEERPVTDAVTDCQGLAWLGQELACVGHGPDGLGLYRVAPDAPEEPRLLGRFTGAGGEHGPHAIVVGPDGALYIAVGNHSGLASAWSPESPYRNYYEGHLLPRYLDPRGHAVDVKAPGGIVVRVDPEGREWRVLAGGLRNAYDLAFNGAGHLFTFDSDMEWDLGLPWYREVRLLHVVPGGEYGWRTGSSPWPNWYPDSLPPACEVGRGSPTGMVCYDGAMFPARYRGALLAGDWSRGRVLAFHLAPHGVSYSAQAEELLLGRPLNATDLAVDKDGSLLISTGGRGTAGRVYRLLYAGERGTAPEPAYAQPWPALPEQAPVAEAFYAIDSLDRWVRFYCMLALERRGLRAGDLGGVQDPGPLAQCLVAAARGGLARADAADCRAGLLRAAELAAGQQGEVQRTALRALDLFLEDADAPPAEELRRVAEDVLKLYPSGDRDADRELVLLIARLAPEGGVPALTAALSAEPSRAEQVHLAYALRALPEGWDDASRKVVADWLASTSSDGGGYSYAGYLRRMRLDFEKLFGPEHADLFPAAGAARPPAALHASGGEPWSFDATLAFLQEAEGAARRSPAEGARVFADTCARCHPYHGGPGSLGPDLSGVGRRFARADLLDAVMHPSRVVPEAYRGLDVFLRDGSVQSGLLVEDGAERLVLARSDGTEVELDPGEVAERRTSALSTMPEGLLAGLTLEQVADLFCLLEADAAPAAPEASAWTRLFDGQTLAGWSGDPALWSVEDGLIAGRAQGLPDSSFLRSAREYGDFMLEFDLLVVAGNSGLQFRSTPDGEHGLHGYQADAGEVYWGSLYEEGGRGMLHRTPDTVWVPAVSPEGFNHYLVEARGERLVIEVNGALTTDLRDAERTRGLLGFQLHRGASEIRVRNVRLREL